MAVGGFICGSLHTLPPGRPDCTPMRCSGGDTCRADRRSRGRGGKTPHYGNLAGLVRAGRLDYLSSGLMILTNDGVLVYRITHPKFKIEKEYLVFLDKPLLESDIQKLTRGYKIESGFARVLAVKTINRSNNQYSIVLNEGKKREIRLLIKGLGIHVKDLQRVRIGQIRLGRLASMGIAPMTKLQIESLR